LLISGPGDKCVKLFTEGASADFAYTFSGLWSRNSNFRLWLQLQASTVFGSNI